MNILIKPIITEKATAAAEDRNVYTFEVGSQANKIEIKKAVESAYGVSVEKVRTINVRPDRKTRFTKTGVQTGKTNGYKKAYVQVAEGDTIDFYSNI
jgi:large subunit ribosomal protein L23